MSVAPLTEAEAWALVHPHDAWIFDKLALAKRLGYRCGPAGVDVPEPGEYVVRPAVNALGMGRGARVERLERCTDHLPLGFFWCERFDGPHYSVDYTGGVQVLCVRGERAPGAPLGRFDRWVRVDATQIPYPHVLSHLTGDYRHVNCEFVGGRLIEAHLRHNPDFAGRAWPEARVVWEDAPPPPGFAFVPAPDAGRLGFHVPA